MEANSLTLTIEPINDLYWSLLDYAVAKYPVALLVVRPELQLSLLGVEVLHRLEPFLMTKYETSEWPGTKLHNGFAYVHRYEFTMHCVSVMKGTANSLYSWQQPELPEDLCVLRANGDPWLVSRSHERDGYLALSDAELAELTNALPELANILQLDYLG